nr:hypothetical protein [Tanacetum cinerariifolium]
MNLPSLLAAHLRRSENAQPLQSPLTSVHGGHLRSVNTRGNRPPTDTHLSHNAQPFVPNNLQPPSGPIHTYVNPYPSRILGVAYGQPLSYPSQPRAKIPPSEGPPPIIPMEDVPYRLIRATRSLVEFLFTDLLTTYKGLMKKTYSWIKAREVSTNGTPNDHRESFDRFKKNSSWDNNKGKKNKDRFSPNHHGDDTNDCWILRHQIKEAMKLGQLAHLVKGIKRSLRVDSKVPLVGFSREHSYPLGEVPLVIIIGDSLFRRMEVLNFVIVRSGSPHNLLLGRTAMQRMGIVVSTIHGSIKFHTPRGIGTVFSTYEPDKIREGQKTLRESPLKQLPPTFKKTLQDLLRTNADIFAWTHADMTRISRTIMVGRKPFNTEHKLNEYKHIKPVKQKKHRLGPDRTRQHARR